VGRGRALFGTVPLPLSLSLPLTWTGMPILGGEHDLQLVKLVPFLFRAIPVGYRSKLLQARSRRIRLRLVHDRYYLIPGHFVGTPYGLVVELIRCRRSQSKSTPP
jgi:hypothetical protein